MSTSFTIERTARKPHECTYCLRTIKPGERYQSHSLPPQGDIGNEHWLRLASHGNGRMDCPRRIDIDPPLASPAP